MIRFPVELHENRPGDDELDQRDAALEAKYDIEREDKIQREVDRDLKQAVAYADSLKPLFDAICKL